MKNMKRSLSAILVPLLLIGLPPAPAVAGSQAEYQALQSWCVGRDKWTAEGRHTDYPNPPEYLHFHHYCAAMNAMNRLYSTIDARKQQYQASLVVGETGYVISHVAETHPLMPEVFALRGRALALIKQNGQAETNLMKALQLDARHVGAYSSLGNLYLDSGRKARAIEMAKAGLAVEPQNKSLRRLAGKLAIKLEELKPAASSPTEQTTQANQDKSAPSPGLDATKPVLDKPSVVGAVPAAATAPADRQVADSPATKPVEKPVSGEVNSGKEGAPKNPWCRFCPESEKSPPPAGPGSSMPATAPKVAP